MKPTIDKSIFLNAAFVAGLGIYVSASGISYLSALGGIDSTFGYISSLGFSLANAIGAIIVCSVMFFFGRGKKNPCFSLLSTGLVCGALSALLSTYDLLALAGFFRGLTAACFMMSYAKICIRLSLNASVVIAAGYLAGSVLKWAYGFLPIAVAPLYFFALFLSFACGVLLQKEVSFDPPYEKHSFLPNPLERRRIIFAVLCVSVCVFVVGLSHTCVLDSDYALLYDNVDTESVSRIAIIVAAIISFSSARLADPVRAYKIILPVLFAVFSLAPIVGICFDALGGSALICCSTVIEILFLVYAITLTVECKMNACFMVSLSIGAPYVALVLGLGVGMLLKILSANQGLPILPLMSVAAIYPLGYVLFVVSSNNKRMVELRESGGEVLSTFDSAAVISQESLEAKVVQLCSECHLTKRECEIFELLAHGRSAPYISESLHISENTVWYHIKNIYAKMCVQNRQELYDRLYQ